MDTVVCVFCGVELDPELGRNICLNEFLALAELEETENASCPDT